MPKNDISLDDFTLENLGVDIDPVSSPQQAEPMEGRPAEPGKQEAVQQELPGLEDFTLENLGFDDLPKVEPKPEEPGVFRLLGRGLGYGSITMAQAVNQIGHYISGKFDSEEGQEFYKENIEYWENVAKDWEAPESLQGSIVEDPELMLRGSWWTYNVGALIPTVAASMVPGIGTAKYVNIAGKAMKWSPKLVAKLSRLSGGVVGGTAGGSIEGANTYQEVLDRGGTMEEAQAAFEMMTLASGALNALSVDKFLKKLPDSRLGRAKARMVRGLTEAITEYLEGPAEAGILLKVSDGSETFEYTPQEAMQKLVDEVNVAPPSFVVGAIMPGAGSIPSMEQGRETDEAQAEPTGEAETEMPVSPQEGEPATAEKEKPPGEKGLQGEDVLQPEQESQKEYFDPRMKRKNYQENLKGYIKALPATFSKSKAVDPRNDEIQEAIAKLGGLDRTEAIEQGIDPEAFKDVSPVFGKPLFPKKGGMSFDEMAEHLSQDGYFPATEPYSANKLLTRLSDSLAGIQQYSDGYQPDPDVELLHGASEGLTPGQFETAIKKALDGEKLGIRQARAVGNLLNELTEERTRPDNLEYARQQLEEARQQRQLLGLGETDDWGLAEEEYHPEMEATGRVMLDLHSEISQFGEQAADRAEAIMEKPIPDEDVELQLASLLKEYQRAQQSAVTAGAGPVTGAPQQGLASQSEAAPVQPVEEGFTQPERGLGQPEIVEQQPIDEMVDEAMGAEPTIEDVAEEAVFSEADLAELQELEAVEAETGKGLQPEAKQAEQQAKTKEKTKSTAPEHAGAEEYEGDLDEIVDTFNEYQEGMIEDGEKITHVFDAPKKDEIVRLKDKVRVYNKEHGWMSVEEAQEKIREWEQHAVDQGNAKNDNSQRVVISLFDLTGEWSIPWEQAGYQVYRFDIQTEEMNEVEGQEINIGDINNHSFELYTEIYGMFEGADVYAVLAACPCTDFASSGARHFAAKDADGRTASSVRLVHQTLNVIEYFKPPVWALENPVGRIEKLGGLPPWRLSFEPNHLGETYTKKTLIWGRFNADLPIAPVEPTEGSKMHQKYGGKSMATKNARSVTPEGFAYSFFMANNAIDNPVIAIANKYDRLDRSLIEKAVNLGITEKQIDEAVEDFYYMDLDDQAANQAIQELIEEQATDEGAPPATQEIVKGMTVKFQGKEYPVESYKEASSKYRKVIKETGAGSRDIDENPIIYVDGQPVAHISYNGNVWPGTEYKKGAEPLFGKTFEGTENIVKNMTYLGQNADGDPVYKDKFGVRKYVRNGVIHSEPQREVDGKIKPVAHMRSDKHKTQEELAKADEKGKYLPKEKELKAEFKEIWDNLYADGRREYERIENILTNEGRFEPTDLQKVEWLTGWVDGLFRDREQIEGRNRQSGSDYDMAYSLGSKNRGDVEAYFKPGYLQEEEPADAEGLREDAGQVLRGVPGEGEQPGALPEVRQEQGGEDLEQQESGQPGGTAQEEVEIETPIDEAAHEAATSPANQEAEPSEAQIEAGNYKKGHVVINGLDISIENPAGTSRREGWPPLAHHYGYIRRTEAKDGEQVDVFLGPDPENADLPVFVINQNVPNTGRFDEHKVMLGFADEAAAKAGYLANYEKGWKGFGNIVELPLTDFKTWLREGDTTKRLVQAPKAEEKTEFSIGDRVVITSERRQGEFKGRHGEISKADKIGMTTVEVFGGRQQRSELTMYSVKTDQGAVLENIREDEFEAETTAAPESLPPDIEYDGQVFTPEQLQNRIGLDRDYTRRYEGKAARARKPEKVAEWKKLAEERRQKVEEAQAALDRWKKANPEAAAETLPEAAAPATAETVAATLEKAGLTVKKTQTNRGKDVWEISGNTKEHKDKIKALGGRWYGPKKVWSFYNGDPSQALAEELGYVEPALEPEPAPVVPDVEVAIPVEVMDTGDTGEITGSAQQMAAETEEKIASYQKLLECLT